MKQELRQFVWERARDSCEYCRLPQQFDPLPFAIDHIRALYHRGLTVAENLALACFGCNTFKSSHAAGFDPESQELTRLFNPRADIWVEHFEWQEPLLVGRTPIGRTTIEVLRINLADRVEHRRSLIEERAFPPASS